MPRNPQGYQILSALMSQPVPAGLLLLYFPQASEDTQAKEECRQQDLNLHFRNVLSGVLP